MTHTLGPWDIDPTDEFVITADCDGLVIAQTDYHDRSVTEQRANARLIAAAPQLLKAVKDADALIERAISILATYIVPDSGISDHEVICSLLECFDGPQQRDVQAANHVAISKAQSASNMEAQP